MEVRVLGILLFTLAVPIYPQTSETTTFESPCPSIFNYEPSVSQLNMTKEAKWHGMVNLSTDITLYALWLNVVVDSEADILGNWVGEVTTEDNLDFKIENTKLKITPDQPLTVRFFIQYKPSNKIPKLRMIRFNGREICSTDNPEQPVRSFTEVPTSKTTNNRYTTTTRPTVSTKRTTTKIWQKTTETPRSQTESDSRLEPNPQSWIYIDNTQTTSRNNPTTKLTENRQTTTVKQPLKQDTTTSKTQTRSPVKAEIEQHTRINQSLSRVEDYLQRTSTERSQVWPYVDNRQQDNPENNQIHQSNSQYWVANNIQLVTPEQRQDVKTESSVFIKQVIESQSRPVSSSQTKTESSYQTRAVENNQGQRFEKLQTESTDGKLFAANQPIFSRSEDKTYDLQARPMDSSVVDFDRLEIKQMKRKDSNVNQNYNTQTYSGDETSKWSTKQEQSNNRESLFGSIDASSYNREITSTRNVDVSGNLYNQYLLSTERSRTTSTTTEAPESAESDYFAGPPSIFIPNQSPPGTSCGKVLLKKSSSYSQRGASMEGQWPWQIALYQQQKATVDFKYICGGTLISRLHVVTAAHCVTRKKTARVVNKVTLTVYLGKTNLRTSVEGVQIKFVNSINVHPAYNGSTFARDLAILELREPVTFSDWVRPACLWPEDDINLTSVIGKSGSLVGWGFEVTGVAREELSVMEMPVVNQQTCINSYIDFYQKFTSDYTYCAGYKEGTRVCNGDSGGGMVFKRGSSWYLRGVASLSVAQQNKFGCDPRRYVIFTDVAKFLPWIQDQIEK